MIEVPKAVQNLIEVAKEVAKEDPIVFPENFDAEAAYALIASGILDEYTKNSNVAQREIILLATTVHLVLENMSLNYRLMESK